MGVDYMTFIAYGVIVDASIEVDEDAIGAAGFQCASEDCYNRSDTFIYLPSTYVELRSRTELEEIEEPIDEEECDDESECEDESNKGTRKNKKTKSEKKRKPVRVGARISVPCPTKKACEALKKFLVDNKLAKEWNADPTPTIFFSLC